MTTNNYQNHQSVLARLRSVVPKRAVSFKEAIRVAEIQASKLLDVLGQDEPDEVPLELITSLPRIRIVADQELPNSGASYWNGQEWIIAVNPDDSRVRQRLTIFHEYKHIVDHGYSHLLYTGSRSADANRQAEQVADYFAGCVLASRRMLKRAWGEGVQRPDRLARLFGISEVAVRVRLDQVGLTDRGERCDPTRRHEVRSFQSYRPYQTGATA
jgi:Zn-dependent peptidase ImmA (M78 family)